MSLRTLHDLPADVWTSLGTGLMVVLIYKSTSGTLLFNNIQSDDTAHIFNGAAVGEQIFNDDVGDTVYVKPSMTGWQVIADVA